MKQFPTFRAFSRLMLLVLGFGGVSMTAACGSSEPSEAESVGPGVDPPEPLAESPLAIEGTFPPGKRASLGASPALPSEPIECRDVIVKQCKRYRIELLGDTNNNIELRKAYKTELLQACYVSATNTFNCYFQTPQKACQEVLKVPIAFGAAPYENHPKTCQKVPGTENWSLQTGSDSANVSVMVYEPAPLQHPLLWVDGVPTLEVNGPYRNLTEPSKVLPGKEFHCYRIDGVLQSKRILEMNRKQNGGKIRSDLAGYVHPCTRGSSMMCTEKTELKDPEKTPNVADEDRAEVDHVASKKDPRGCDWGTNSNKNAAVISRRLNNYFSNDDRPKAVVDTINAIPAYIP